MKWSAHAIDLAVWTVQPRDALLFAFLGRSFTVLAVGANFAQRPCQQCRGSFLYVGLHALAKTS